MGYSPSHSESLGSNVYGEETFRIRITFGSSVIASYRSKDVTVARNTAGNYTLTFPQEYNEITEFSWGIQDASGAILFAVVTSETLATDGKMIVETRTEAGTATDPTSGDKLFLTVGLTRDVANNQYTA